jgi:hypothetical protein
VKNQSAPILVSGSGSHLALLGAGANLNAKGNVTVFYTAVPVTTGKTVEAIKLPGGGLGFFAATLADKPLPPAPTGQPWVSDLEWTDSSNGWGPVECDQSNGEDGDGDGDPLTLAGTQYAKGIGTHAPSSISVRLGANCSTFTAQVGVDDEMEDRGQVSFKVAVDGVVKYTRICSPEPLPPSPSRWT